MKRRTPNPFMEAGTETPNRGVSRSWLPLLAGIACWLPQAVWSAVVFDQIGDLSSFDSGLLPPPAPSQIFTDFPASSSVVLEDFQVTSAELRIESVAVLLKAFAGFSMFEQIEGFRVNFFSDVDLAATTLQGDAGSTEVPKGPAARVTPVSDQAGDTGTGRVEIDVDVDLPGPGTYWVGVSPIAANTVSGQFFVQTSTTGTSGEPNARLANPGEGLGAGALSVPGHHYAYSVTVVPEPSVAMLQLLALATLVVRRHRRQT